MEREGTDLAATASRSLLQLGLYGYALSLLLSFGTYRQALWVCLAGVIGAGLLRPSEFRLERPLGVMLGFGLVFLAQGWLLAAGPIEGGFHWALIWAMVVATAVTLVPDRPGRRWSHREAAGALLLLFVVVQHVAFFLVKKKYWAGLFSNIHYMALFSVITMPILGYLAARAKSSWRVMMLLILLGDFLLLMKTHSRPGYLAWLASALVAVPFIPGRFRNWVLVAILGIPVLLYTSGLFGFAATINDLITHFAKEERPMLWRAAWELQQQSTGVEWWFGHGLGQFFRDYWIVPRREEWNDHYAAPHNYFLELLYSHGWIGLGLFVLAFALLFWYFAAAIHADTDKLHRQYGIALAGSVTAAMVMGFLTLPFFSRHNLFPLSIILGASLRYIAEARRDD